MSRVELAQAILRACGYVVLALAAGWVWARPYRPGVTSKEALAIAGRAKRWTFLAVFGAVTQFGRTLGVPSQMVDLTGTITVFTVVTIGLLSLDSGSRR